MSTIPTSNAGALAVPPPGRPASEPARDAEREQRRQMRQLRAAACQERLRMASDALAAVDLLLGMNWSTSALDAKERASADGSAGQAPASEAPARKEMSS